MTEAEDERLFFRYRHTDAVIIVYDCCDPDSLAKVDCWSGEIDRYLAHKIDNDMPVNVIMVANKKDRLKEAILEATTHVIDFNIAVKWASALGYRCIETSAKSGENIQELFKMVAEELLYQNKVPDSVDVIGGKVQKFMYVQLPKILINVVAVAMWNSYFIIAI